MSAQPFQSDLEAGQANNVLMQTQRNISSAINNKENNMINSNKGAGNSGAQNKPKTMTCLRKEQITI